MSTTVEELRLLYRRMNEKESLGVFDLCILDKAIKEIGDLRHRVAVNEAELQKRLLEARKSKP